MTTPLFPLIVSAALGQQGEVILPEIAPVEFRSISVSVLYQRLVKLKYP